MENIKIDITANGITTLATAGKYCDRNIDVEVLVEGGGGGGSSLLDSEGSVFMTVDGEVFCVDGNDRLVDVDELPLVESTSDNLVYKTPVKYTDTVYLVKSEPREKSIDVIPYQVTETEVTVVDSGGVKMSGVVVIAGHTTVTSPVAVTETSITIYADMDGEWVYTGSEWLPFTNVLPSEFDASAYKGMTYDVPTTSSTAGLYLHFNEQYDPRKVTVTNISNQYEEEGGSITVIYRDEIDNIDSPMVTSDELNPIVYVINDVAYTHNGSEFVEWCAPTLDSFLKGKRVAEPPTTDSADGVYFVRSTTPVSFGIPTTNADIFQNIEGVWKQLGHRRVVDASKFPKPGETGVSGGGASRTFCNLFTVDSGAINDWSTIYRMIGNSVNIIIVDDHTSVESPIEWMNGTEITFYADNTNIWQYSNGAWSQGLGDRVYHGVVSTVPTESSPNGTYIYNQVIPYNRLKAEVICGNKEGEYTLSAAIGEALGVPCSTILVDNHSNVGNPVESNETNIHVYADETGAWAYADGAWVDVLAMLTGATVPYLGIVVSPFDLSNFMDTLAYTYVQEAVNGSIWMVDGGMCMDITSMLEAQLGLHATSYTVISDHTAVTSPEVFDMTTMSGAVYVDDVDIWAYVPDMGGWNGLFYDIMGMPAEMPFFNATEPPTSASATGAYFVPVELSTGDGTVDPNFVPYDKDLVYKVTTKEGETNLYHVYDIGNGTIKVQDERVCHAQFSGTLDFIFVEDHTTIEEPLISKEYNSTTYYVDSTGIWYLANSGGWICKCSTYSIVSEPPTVESAVGYYLVKATESVGVGVADPDVSVSQITPDGREWRNLTGTITTLEGQVEELGELKERVTTLTTENTNLEAQVDTLTTENTNLEAQVDTLTTENAELQFYYDETVPSMNFMKYATLSGSEDGVVLTDVTADIASIKLHNNVNSIGNDAFEGCTGLSVVIFENGAELSSIGEGAFSDCSNLTTVYYKGTAEEWDTISIGLSNESLTSATRYYYSETKPMFNADGTNFDDNYWYYDVNGGINIWGEEEFFSQGLAYTLNSDGVSYSVTDIGTCTDTVIVIDSKYNDLPVTTIGYNVFRNRSDLQGVVIPDSVTSTAKSAFLNCNNLTKVVISNNITTINTETFCNCTSLTSVIIPNSVTTIGYMAFYNCSSLTSVVIPDSVTTIDSYAFNSCDNLTSVVIGASVATISTGAFSGCSGLTSITVSGENANYQSIDGNLYTKDGKTLIQYATDKKATHFTIPDSVETIGGGAFYNCDNLTSVVIPDGVITIKFDAFDNCSSLTSVKIPDSVETIGDKAFYNCLSLTSVEIGASVATISNSAFSGCSGLTSITVSGENANYQSIDGNLYTKDGETLIKYATGKTATSFTIPDSITSIGDYVFYNCLSLTSVVIPDSVTTIGGGAFYYCYSLTSVYYKGTAEDWSNISIGNNNGYLTNATRYYYSEEQPTEEGNFWHYDENGEIVIW